MIQVQVCSRRPPPASPRASRKFASSEIRDSESGGSDLSEKLSLLSGESANSSEKRVALSSASANKGKTCVKKSTVVNTTAVGSPLPGSPKPASPANPVVRRPSTKSPCNPPANPILEEVPETQPQQNNQEIEEMTCPSLQDTSNLVILDDNLEKMNVQNGLNSITEQRENGNPPPSIVPRENTDTVETNKSLSEEKLTNSKSKNKSARCDSTDALLSDEEKSLVDENNPMD